MRGHVRPDRSFQAVEVGTLGYLTHLRMIDAFGLINASREFPKQQNVGPYIRLMAAYQPDLVLARSLRDARTIERITGYRIAKKFPWEDQWSTLLLRSPDSRTT